MIHFLEFHPRLPQQQSWDQNPHTIEKYQVDPKVQPIVGVEVGASHKPLRGEGHPPAIQLTHAQSNLNEVPVKEKETRDETASSAPWVMTASAQSPKTETL